MIQGVTIVSLGPVARLAGPNRIVARQFWTTGRIIGQTYTVVHATFVVALRCFLSAPRQTNN